VASGSIAATSANMPQRTIHGYGLSVRLPAGWTGKIYRPCGASVPSFQAANFRLPASAKDDVVGTKAERLMTPHRVRIVLLEIVHDHGSGSAFTRYPVRVDRSNFAGVPEGIPLTAGFARERIILAGRHFDLWVVFGVRPPPAALLGGANATLRTLHVDPRRPSARGPCSRTG
jgi:hypothetical protein